VIRLALHAASETASETAAGNTPDRRVRLKQLLGVSGLLALGLALRRADAIPRSLDIDDGLGQLGFGPQDHRAALARLGALYLGDHPLERDRGHLSRLLAGNADVLTTQGLIAAIARDWRSHDVTVVDGWVLARSEARICAIVHLNGGDPA
jgi:hypothetical protein